MNVDAIAWAAAVDPDMGRTSDFGKLILMTFATKARACGHVELERQAILRELHKDRFQFDIAIERLSRNGLVQIVVRVKPNGHREQSAYRIRWPEVQARSPACPVCNGDESRQLVLGTFREAGR